MLLNKWFHGIVYQSLSWFYESVSAALSLKMFNKNTSQNDYWGKKSWTTANHGERRVRTHELSYATATSDAQRPFQGVPQHSWTTKISTGTSQSKGGDREMECCIFRLAEKRCPLTRGAQLKKHDILVYFWSACRALITLKLTWIFDNINPNK